MSDTLNLFARFSAWWLGPNVFRVTQLWSTIRNGLRPDRLRKRHKPAKRPAPVFWRAPAIFLVPLDQPLDGVLAVQNPKSLTVVHDWGPRMALWLAGRHVSAGRSELPWIQGHRARADRDARSSVPKRCAFLE